MKRLCIALLLLMLLCGCMDAGNELLTLPEPPSNYIQLQKQLDMILKDGTSYSSPTGGMNRGQIQFIDLDNDGMDEILSFFRNESALMVYIHRLRDGKYEEVAKISGEGDSFDSIWYPRLDTSGKTAIVVGWKLGNNPIRGASIFMYENGAVKPIYSGEYTGITVSDINGNGGDDILLLRHTTTTEAGRASLLSYESGELKEISSAPLSAGVVNPKRIRAVDIGYGIKSVTVEASIFEKSYVTDILTFKNGVLSNLLYSESAKMSILTNRYLPIYTCDINKDQITEIPRPEVLPGYNPQTSDIQWSIDWCVYDPILFLKRKITTYMNITDRWYLKIPDELVGNYTVERGFDSQSHRSVIFYEWNRAEGKRGKRLWEIYKITGEKRYEMLEEQELWELARTYDTLYAIRLFENTENASSAFSKISNCFFLLENEWVYENWALMEN